MNSLQKSLLQDAKNVLDSGDKVAARDVLKRIVEEVENDDDPSKKWWVIVLKTIVYLIGLLLAGVGTAQAANLLIP